MPRKFLIVESHSDSASLIERTLLRKFPDATITTSPFASDGAASVQATKYDAIIVHRAVGTDGVDVVRALRSLEPLIPIVMMSSVDGSEAATKAGATKFLAYDAWLMLGPLVEDLLKKEKEPSKEDDQSLAGAH